MSPLSDDELEGFEYQLTEWQNYLDDFDEECAHSDFAADKGFPEKDEGFRANWFQVLPLIPAN